MRGVQLLRLALLRAALGGAIWLASGMAHAAGWEVRALKAGADAQMPWVTGADAAVADRIDTLLFLDVLEAAPPKGNPTAFALPARRDGPTPVTPSEFRVLRQDERVLSLLVMAEGCGAYCESFEKPFLFDLASGRRVTDRELLTPQGAQAIARQGLQAFVAAIGKELAALRAPRARDLPDDDRATLRLAYEDCREMRRGWAREGKLVGSLRVGGSGAELVFERCTPHVIRALDDLGDYTHRISAAALAGALTPYGRRLLLGEGEAKAGAGPVGQVFAGTVGNAAIRLATSPLEDDGSFSGTYYDERYRKPISIHGRFADGVWALSENDGEASAHAEWVLKRSGTGPAGAWNGTWTGADGRRLPVSLKP